MNFATLSDIFCAIFSCLLVYSGRELIAPPPPLNLQPSAMSFSNKKRGQTTVLRKRTLEVRAVHVNPKCVNYPRHKKPQETLLNEEERAALEAIDASLSPEEKESTVRRVYQCMTVYFCNRASFALITMFVLTSAGAILFGVSHAVSFHNEDTVRVLRKVGAFLFSAGLFGFFGGCANLIALIMLFYEFPLCYGTGYVL